jgi:outer membrane protein assembly factor BamE (lipoprotein component of BamABCDE complex)
MRTTALTLCVLLAAASLSPAIAAPKKPVPGVVTSAQLDQIHEGQTRDEVIAVLGQPKHTTKWRTGTSSMVYKLEGNGISGHTTVYVDLNTSTQKVLTTTVKDEQEK